MCGEYFGWALEMLGIEEVHKITRGSGDVVVACIDLGFKGHPFFKAETIPGYDFEDDDTTLEYSGPTGANSDYLRGHHLFVASQVYAVAPKAKIINIRVGYRNPDSFEKAVRYAVSKGANILLMPHGYINGLRQYKVPLFYTGTDFGYPSDNTSLIKALFDAYESGCLIFSGTSDNRGRRAATYTSIDAVCAVGSINRHKEPSDFCSDADYTEFSAPAGQRSGSKDDEINGPGPDDNMIYFTGGCMASAFAAGCGACVMSVFPKLKNHEVRQVLRNTAYKANNTSYNEDGFDPKTGYGIIDLKRAVTLTKKDFDTNLDVGEEVRVLKEGDGYCVMVQIINKGVFDFEKGIAVLYNNDPDAPTDREGTFDKPARPLQTRQLGHRIFQLRGFWKKDIIIRMDNRYKLVNSSYLWVQIYSVAPGHEDYVLNRRIHIKEVE